jgi:hypothetical protein
MSDSGSQAPNIPPPVEADPFLQLHKMSTTAGLGSADYVAINGTALAAILLGIVSAFMLLNSAVLLVFPLAGIFCSLLAFRQINHSNGTQTGRGLATIGLLLSLGFGGFYTVGQTVDAIRNRADRNQMIALIDQFGQFISRNDYHGAYNLCDQRFQQRVTEAAFTARFKAANGSPIIGSITSMEWNQVLQFNDDPVTRDRLASTMVMVHFSKVSGVDREGTVFRKIDGQWWIDDIPGMFPPESTR